MTIPTRMIEEDEFKRLIKEFSVEEGDTVTLLSLTPYTFGFHPDSGYPESIPGVSIGLVFLNIIEPLIYRDPELRRIVVIANALEDWDYNLIRDLHPDHDADTYVLAPWGWNLADFDHMFELCQVFSKHEEMKFDRISIEPGEVRPLEERGELH